MKMHPIHIQRAATAVREVESIDETIKWLGRDVESNADDWGRKVRGIFGQNRLTQLRHCDLGEITFCAVVNALLKEREQIIEDFAEVVEFPEPPCPEQRPSGEHEATTDA